MTLGALIKALYERSGMSQDDYASHVAQCTRTHFNAVILGRVDANAKMAERALHHAKLKWEHCVHLPISGDDETLLNIYRDAISAGGYARDFVKGQSEILQRLGSRVVDRNQKSPAKRTRKPGRGTESPNG